MHSAAASPGKVGGLCDDVTVDDVTVETTQLMTLSSGFKEKNGFHCLARARTNMKNAKETVYHCYNCCEMFSQFDVSFWDLYLLHPPTSSLSYL